MSHYRSNVRDLEFMLFEVLDRQSIMGQGPYADIDADTARELLHEVAALAEGQLGESLLDSDRNPPVFDPATGTATLPESFRRSYKAWESAEFWRLGLPEALGGTSAPPSLTWALAEFVLGANPAVYMYAAGYQFASVLHELGTPDQQRLAELMVENDWGATMVLTEPDAGSDVGAGRTRAVQQPDGTWHIEGVKRFITSGESDLAENIVHFVLARPEGAGPGTKGLSLFIVPKFHVDLATGELGARNGAHVTNVEHKMGLKISTTCEVRFGENEPAVGTLLADSHDGIAQMFRIIEYARMMVGTKAIATLSTGYLNALEYAKERVQGSDLAELANKAAPRVTITHHPDVRRSLMTQKAHAEGLRALMLYAAAQQDAVKAAQIETGRERVDPDSEAGRAAALNDLLLPLVKGVGSERAWVLLGTESLQTLGGSGFLQDYPIEQYVRDAKIDTLYEGTTAIQGQDLFFRKILRDNGATLTRLGEEIADFARTGPDALATERRLLGTALEDLQAIVAFMVDAASKADPRAGADGSAIYLVGQNTTRLLMVLGDIVVAWLLLRQAAVALEKVDAAAGTEKDFYTGKIAAARFYAGQQLPRVHAERTIATHTDLSLMEVPESAF